MPNEKIDLLICEAAHFSPEDYILIFKKYDIKKICFNHYSESKINEITMLKTIFNNIQILSDDFNIET